jgi:hypothetical protein
LCLNSFEFDAIDVDEGLVGGVAIGDLNGFILGLLLGGEDVVGGGHEGFQGDNARSCAFVYKRL